MCSELTVNKCCNCKSKLPCLKAVSLLFSMDREMGFFLDHFDKMNAKFSNLEFKQNLTVDFFVVTDSTLSALKTMSCHHRLANETL